MLRAAVICLCGTQIENLSFQEWGRIWHRPCYGKVTRTQLQRPTFAEIRLRILLLFDCELNCKVVGWFRFNPDSLVIASPDFWLSVDSTRFTRSEGITRHWTFVVSPCYTSGITSSNWLGFQHNLQLIEEKSMFILQRSQVIWSQDNITINTFWSNYRKCEQHFHSTRNAERFAGVLYRVTKTGWPRKTITTPPPTRLRAWASCPSGVLHSITITYQTIGTRINNLCKHMSTITHNLKLAMDWFSLLT